MNLVGKMFLMSALLVAGSSSCSAPAPEGKDSINTTMAAVDGVDVEDAGSEQFEVVYTEKPPTSVEAISLRDFSNATSIELISLTPWDYQAFFAEEERQSKLHTPDLVGAKASEEFNEGGLERQSRSQNDWCQPGPCIEGNRIAGKISIEAPELPQFLLASLKDWYEKSPNFALACAAEYHHAVAFSAEGKRYEILLCYSCGQYQILVDGKSRASGQGASASGLEEMNSMFKAAGIPYFVPQH